MAKEQELSSYETLEVFEGLAYLRKRAYVNMGSTSYDDNHNSRAQIQMAQEIVSNALDEAINGFGDKIEITVHEDQSFTVKDHGRGLPRDLRERNKETGEMEIIEFGGAVDAFTRQGTGGKFGADENGQSSYKYSGGLNAIGAKGTMALSKYIEIEAQTVNGQHYRVKIDYDKFVETEEPEYAENLPYDDSLGTGTTVTFLPDVDAFSPETGTKPSIEWKLNAIKDRLEQSAYTAPKTEIILTDERDVNPDTHEPAVYRWYSEHGLDDYVKVLSEDSTPLQGFKDGNIEFDDSVDAGDDKGNIEVHGSIQWTDSTGIIIKSFANGIPTAEHGPHVTGLMSIIRDQINDFVNVKRILKKNQRLDDSDIQDGLIAAIEVKIPENILQFEGQTKEKLGTNEARKAVRDVAGEAIKNWLYDNEDDARDLIDHMDAARQSREDAAKNKREIQKAKKAKKDVSTQEKLIVSDKLTKPIVQDPKISEVMIVEGDSAGTSTVKARYPHQGVFPLRGKLINVFDNPEDRIMKNAEINTLISMAGTGYGPAYEEKDILYNKYIILTDADDDGEHIRSLVQIFYFKYLRQLVENGHLYVVKAPLYRLTRYEKGKQINAYAFDGNELEKQKEEWSKYKDVRITRFKGLGESNPEDLRDTVMNPEKRRLIQVTVGELEEAKKNIDMIMTGNQKDKKSEWVRENLRIDDEDLSNLQ